MRVLAIGDVVGKGGTDFLRFKLKKFQSEHSVDLTIANGENSAEGNGILPDSARKIFDAGVDVITNGNHTFRRKEIFMFMNENERIIRPYNYPSKKTPGSGFCKLKVKGINVAVINILGVSYLNFARSSGVFLKSSSTARISSFALTLFSSKTYFLIADSESAAVEMPVP